jgi:hypothetical protein
MAQIVCPLVAAADRARLEAIVADRNRVRKHVARARILSSAERLSVGAVARQAGLGRPAVWRWQRRFAQAGVDGLLREASRKPGKAPLGDATIRRVVALTCAEPPGAATHCTGRAMAKSVGISLRSVQRIWQAHDLQPHRIRTFKRSTDPEFAAKLEDIVGPLRRPAQARDRALNRYIAVHNDDPKPFTWTKISDQILAKLNPRMRLCTRVCRLNRAEKVNVASGSVSRNSRSGAGGRGCRQRCQSPARRAIRPIRAGACAGPLPGFLLESIHIVTCRGLPAPAAHRGRISLASIVFPP